MSDRANDWRHRLWLAVAGLRVDRRWIAAAAVIALLALNFLFTAEYERHNQDAARQQQATERAVGCRQFGALVESIVQANAETEHAVTASKSFGQLFAEAVRTYYEQTGCSRYFVVSRN